MTSVQVVIYCSVYTHHPDVLKVTQTGWVSKAGTGTESIYSASRAHITSSALHEGQFGPWRSSKLNQGQVYFNTSNLMNWEQNPTFKGKNLKIKTCFTKIAQVQPWEFRSAIMKVCLLLHGWKHNSLCFSENDFKATGFVFLSFYFFYFLLNRKQFNFMPMQDKNFITW